MASAIRKITLGGGCFWCVETAFKRLKGVQSVMPGYSGGHKQKPTYEEVKKGDTGHAEIVQIEYNPNVIGTEKILDVFFFIHDPTQLNRQGPDVGTQYRSAIFYHDIDQKVLSEKAIDSMSGKLHKKIVTQVKPAGEVFPAEQDHVDYFVKNPDSEYCQTVVKPKIEKLKQQYKDILKTPQH